MTAEILIIDDNPDIRSILNDVIIDSNYTNGSDVNGVLQWYADKNDQSVLFNNVIIN